MVNIILRCYLYNYPIFEYNFQTTCIHTNYADGCALKSRCSHSKTKNYNSEYFAMQKTAYLSNIIRIFTKPIATLETLQNQNKSPYAPLSVN